MANYLLELGMEEIPARLLKRLSQQLHDRVSTFLEENHLTFDSIESFATPRRLAVRVINLDLHQADTSEKIKGPALKIAKDEQGQWSKAALGFIKGQGGHPEDIFIEKFKGEDYIFIHKLTPGKSASEVLPGLADVLGHLTFPVAMRWNTLTTSFIRPVHWLVSLLDDQILPLTFMNIEAGRQSMGHRFLGQAFELSHADRYVEALKDQFVLVDFEERENMIRQQIYAMAQDENWAVPIDADLLEEVAAIVEWPTAFYGDFEAKYLEIPALILITAMRDHQRYFYVLDESSRELLPHFISVRNGDDRHLENVVKGNQKVLRARLEDALFFYQEDLQTPLETYLDKLSSLNEHYKLGNFAQKQDRVHKIVSLLAAVVGEITPENLADAQRAAQIYKFDLMTGVVGEFSELQGAMGEIYALKFGENDNVAAAIGSQYFPTHSGGELPHGQTGALLAAADKLDSLVQYFSVGLMPTGSNDPYALRRQATGLVEIILSQHWNFDVKALLTQVLAQAKLNQSPELLSDLLTFIQARLDQKLSGEGIDYDIIEAISQSTITNINQNYENALYLQACKYQEGDRYKGFVENLTRIMNLGHDVSSSAPLDKALAQSPSEEALLDFVLRIEKTMSMDHFYPQIVEGHNVIVNYFEQNMVHDDRADIRQNRLATLRTISNLVGAMMDPRKLISKY